MFGHYEPRIGSKMITKQFILASLVIFLAQPILAMNRDLEDSTDITNIAIQKSLIDPFSKWPEGMSPQEKLDTLLIKTIKQNTIEVVHMTVPNLLNAGANPNAYDADMDYSVLMFAAKNGDCHTCETLLEHGADLRTKNKSNHTALTQAIRRGQYTTSGVLMVHARFYPLRSATDRKASRDRILTALLCWKRICTRLPKDIRRLILLNYLPDDALNCPTYLCKSMIHLMPPQIACKLLGQETAVAQLIKYKYEQLEPLMIEAANESIDVDAKMFILNPEWLEQNFGEEIKEVIIADCLGKQRNEI